MVNNEIIILRNVANILRGQNLKVGYYRNLADWKVAMGQNFPVILIEDGDEFEVESQNLSVQKEFPVHIWVYHQLKKNLTETMTDLCTLIEDTLLDDSFLNTLNSAITGTVSLIKWTATEKGDHLESFDGRSVGFTDDRLAWRLSFLFNFHTAR